MEARKLGYIDAVRGLAILMVLTVHAGRYVGDFVPYTAWGARGVQLFFAASAFTLAMSWDGRNDGAVPFYIRRLFRIAPLFWLAIVFNLTVWGFEPFGDPPPVEMWHVVATATFTHGFFPQTVSFVVLGGWSIAAEMMFYAIFPLLALVVRGTSSSLICLVVSAACAMLWSSHSLPLLEAIWPNLDHQTLLIFKFLAFPKQLTAFAAGLAAYHISKEWRPRPMAPRILLLASIAWCLWASIYNDDDIVGFGIAFGAALLALSTGAGSFLPNRILNHFGEISFSMYLLHFYVLAKANQLLMLTDLSGWSKFATLWLLSAAICYAVCSATYKWLEKPCMNLGRDLAKVMRGRVPTTAR